MKARITRSHIRLICTQTLLCLTFALSGCTDVATRLAYDIEKATGELSNSNLEELELVHYPRRFPDGCKGSYEVQLYADSGEPIGRYIYSGLSVKCAEKNNASSTNWYQRFVKVPKTLTVTKNSPDEPVWLRLRRTSTGIEIIGMR